jgi:Animal haem peroxidase
VAATTRGVDVRENPSRALARWLLAAIRLVNGTLALFLPRLLARRLGVDPRANPAMLYVLRMFGIRTVLLGLDLFRPAGERRDEALRRAVVIHALDTVAAALAAVSGRLPPRTGILITAISMLNTALAVYARGGARSGERAQEDTAPPASGLLASSPSISAGLSVADLTTMSQAQLDAAFAGASAGPIPDGDTEGAVLVAPQTELAGPAQLLVRWLVWQGKVFDRARGELVNKVSPLGIRVVKAKVYVGESWSDGRPAVILDYSRTSLIARKVRDELRQVGPDTYLGVAYWDRTPALMFALQLPGTGVQATDPWAARRELGPLTRLVTSVAQAIDWTVHWWRLPTPLAIPVLLAARVVYRHKNLYDTGLLPTIPQPPPVPEDGRRYLSARTADGSFNDLSSPTMGAANTRFGRNVPLSVTAPEPQPDVLTPNPRTVSHALLTRQTFQPATSLNLLAAAWLQFMVHDWLSHGANTRDDPWQIDVPDADWTGPRPLTILRTRPDPTRPDRSDTAPASFLNTATHWWDGSQLYGSDAQTQARLRAHEDGKLTIQPDGLLPLDPEHGVDLTGVNGNYWIGLSLLHTMFAREHNAICDRLKQEYPGWSDDELFDHARLINAALMAKIHTVEWTTAILANPTTVFALRGNWWGLEQGPLFGAFGRIGHNDLISGIPGSDTDHHAAPYSITEEFVAVYRMHPLLPDDYSIRSLRDDSLIQELTFPEVGLRGSRQVAQAVPLADLFYSFGTSHPGAITLHNYPRFLQTFTDDEGHVVDLAATDILRSRERGTPRYNEFRRLMHLPQARTFEDLTDNPVWARQIRDVYEGQIDRVDLQVGLYAEPLPPGFGFSDTAFRIFVLMASRRLKSDRFFTVDYGPALYTRLGIDWIETTTLADVLTRHYPALVPTLARVRNAFQPWPRSGAA